MPAQAGKGYLNFIIGSKVTRILPHWADFALRWSTITDAIKGDKMSRFKQMHPNIIEHMKTINYLVWHRQPGSAHKCTDI